MFCHYNNKIINTAIIKEIDCKLFTSNNTITVCYYDNFTEKVVGAEAVNLIMLLVPSVLEGMNADHVKHSWAIHNLIGHPAMQILTWLGLSKLGIMIHDHTVPKPEIKK